MKHLFLILLFSVPCALLQGQNIQGSRLTLDSTALPTAPKSGRIVLSNQGIGNAYVTYSDGSRHNLDSVVVPPESKTGFQWQSVSAADTNNLVFEAPEALTVDSIRVVQSGASAMTVNAKRIRSGTPADLLSGNYSVTTSMTTATGLQNTGLQKNDQVWFMIRSITGTTTWTFMQINYHK